MIFSKTLIQLI